MGREQIINLIRQNYAQMTWNKVSVPWDEEPHEGLWESNRGDYICYDHVRGRYSCHYCRDGKRHHSRFPSLIEAQNFISLRHGTADLVEG
jgi:hypothetical protein